jgi:hypothetical protein
MISFEAKTNALEVANALNRIKSTLPYSLKKEMISLMREYRKKIIKKIRDGGYGLSNSDEYRKWKISRTNLHKERAKPLISTGNFFKSYEVRKIQNSKTSIIRLKLGPEAKQRPHAIIFSGKKESGTANTKQMNNITIATLLAKSEYAHLYKEVKNIKLRVIRRILKILSRKIKYALSTVGYVK